MSYASSAARNKGKFVAHKSRKPAAGETLVRKYSSATALPFAKVLNK